MKIKLNKGFEIGGKALEANAVIELEQEPAQALIDDGTASEYTSEMEAQDLAAQEQMLAEAKKAEAKTCEPEPVITEKGLKMKLFTKAVKDVMLTKAATDYAGTEATEVMGEVSRVAELFALATKMPVSGNLKINYSQTNATGDALPAVAKTNESTTNATTVPVGYYDAIPAKWFATVKVATELAEDLPSLETFITKALRNQLALKIDGDILAGAFTSNYGFKGITTDTNASQALFADLDAPTKDELLAMQAKVDPALQKTGTWALSPTFWNACISELLDANNIGNQLITIGANKTLLGNPVIVTLAAPAAHPAVFGDFSDYLVGIRRDVTVEVDKSNAFDSDETIVKISGRFAGGLSGGKRLMNGVTYASMVYASETGAS